MAYVVKILGLTMFLLGFCWTGSAGAANGQPTRPTLNMVLHVDGSVELDGVHFSDGDKLKAKLTDLSHRKPTPFVIPRADKNTELRTWTAFLPELADLGLLPSKIGFIGITEPHK